MRHVAGPMFLLVLLAAPGGATDPSPTPGEAELQALLKDHSPGPPQRCIVVSNIRKMWMIDRTALVVSRGRTILINRTSNPGALRSDLVPAYDPNGNQVCSGSPVSLNTSGNLLQVGAVRLGEWVPYRRNDKPSKQ